MKNIHVLPTDKPTWLHKSILTGILRKSSSCIDDMKQAQGMNIYITSDEEIKDKCYVLSSKSIAPLFLDGVINTASMLAENQWRKVILTDNKDLIKDGVQAIDDEFLEWFVKNPSCKRVELSLEETQYGNGIYEYVIYKKEIPKEEPKQETLEKYSERFNNKENEVVDGIFNPENWGRRVVKQETLEEVAKKKYPMFKGETYIGNNKKMLKRAAFIAGAKWQQEQNKNLYSEEDLEKAYKDGGRNEYDFINKYHCKARISFDKWFEQFKKK